MELVLARGRGPGNQMMTHRKMIRTAVARNERKAKSVLVLVLVLVLARGKRHVVQMVVQRQKARNVRSTRNTRKARKTRKTRKARNVLRTDWQQ